MSFLSPVEDYAHNSLDLNELLIQKSSSTFFLKMKGPSMVGAGIYHQDLLIVDRSLDLKNKDVIIASLNGEMRIQRFLETSRGKFLCSEPSHNHSPDHFIKIHPGLDFQLWGVVVHSVRAYR